MRSLIKILFGLFLIFLFLEILVGFPISLEHEPMLLPKQMMPKTEKEIEKEKAEESKRDDEKKELSNLTTAHKMKSVQISESRKGTRDWEFFSESAESENKSSKWKFQTVKVFFYNNDKIDFIVTGDRGSIEPGSKDMNIDGNVVTKSANGYIFRSQSIAYTAEKRIISSPDFVRMTGPTDDSGNGLQLTGNKMETFVDNSEIHIKENVNSVKKFSDGKQMDIHSRSAQFSGKDRSAKFYGEVLIQIGGMKMEGPEAQFDYRSGKDVLQSVKVFGGAKVSDMDKYATSDTVHYDPEKNDFTFTGRPRVVQNNDEIIGDTIVFVDGGKRVKVEKIKAKMEKPKEND